MNYSRFTIEYFRSFQDRQKLNLSIPDREKEGSGLTFLVGENNAGKTTIIEGIFLHDEGKIRSSEKQSGGTPCFALYDANNELKRKLQLIRENSYTLKADPNINADESFEIIPSRRHWQSTVNNTSKMESVINTTISQTPRSPTSTTQVASALRDIESDEEEYKRFILYVKRVIPMFSSFAIGYEDQEFIEYTTSDGVKHKSDYLGDGVISIIRILTHLFIAKPRPLIIDEPELSLHPNAQKKLLELIGEASKNRQIIVSTHSPYFVSWEYIKNGAMLNRVSKHDDIKSEIFCLKEYATYQNMIKAANWQQPFLMDIVAKEIFFNDNILFVEGQEDVGLLKRESEFGDDVNIFGYGVRGKDSFNFALKLAQDLGIKKSCVILDAGEEEKLIYEKLTTDFPDYKVIQWDRNDIRDKVPRTLSQKIGYFDEHGNKKPESELGEYNQKIKEISEYFNNSIDQNN